ncbi:hypothetical protein DET57_103136 [Klebsiella oxytoca]|uniref:Uncharacterized protein n=1 Tax=Klebsiella oxytoca TaxID=571 RepID=A0A318FW41_KLEOX|nr:hypothetical protein DET57_103136 [Klebsiella oxytoca]
MPANDDRFHPFVGHIGLNEPGEELELFCHISDLDEQTRQHDMLKTAGHSVEQRITLGLKDILIKISAFLSLDYIIINKIRFIKIFSLKIKH